MHTFYQTGSHQEYAKSEKQPTFELDEVLQKKNMLFSKNQLELGKVIGQGQCLKE